MKKKENKIDEILERENSEVRIRGEESAMLYAKQSLYDLILSEVLTVEGEEHHERAELRQQQRQSLKKLFWPTGIKGEEKDETP